MVPLESKAMVARQESAAREAHVEQKAPRGNPAVMAFQAFVAPQARKERRGSKVPEAMTVRRGHAVPKASTVRRVVAAAEALTVRTDHPALEGFVAMTELWCTCGGDRRTWVTRATFRLFTGR